MDDDLFISRRALAERLGHPDAPFLLDVRRDARFAPSEHRLASALRVLPSGETARGARASTALPAPGWCAASSTRARCSIARPRPRYWRVPARWARWPTTSQALHRLATLERGADTNRLDLDPVCAGLSVYDALYAWCVAELQHHNETHTWRPA